MGLWLHNYPLNTYNLHKFNDNYTPCSLNLSAQYVDREDARFEPNINIEHGLGFASVSLIYKKINL